MGLFSLRKNSKQREKESIDERQKEFIEMASKNSEMIVDAYNEAFEKKLNFSEDSLDTLDQILDSFSTHKDEIDPEMKSDVICQAGSYIFEVARRNYGGKYYWYDPLNQPILVTGQPNFEISMLAFEKVEKRIENGKADSIPFFFSGYRERVKNGRKGDMALVF